MDDYDRCEGKGRKRQQMDEKNTRGRHFKAIRGYEGAREETLVYYCSERMGELCPAELTNHMEARQATKSSDACLLTSPRPVKWLMKPRHITIVRKVFQTATRITDQQTVISDRMSIRSVKIKV